MVTVMETQQDSMGVGSHIDSDEDDDCPSSPGSPSFDDGALMAAAMGHDVTAQLAAAGTVGMAAAAAIVSSKKKKRPHSFETNPSIRKRQQNRLLRKLKQTIDEFATRVGQQAVVLVATPGKPNPSFKCFGAKPLEDVMKTLKASILDELEHALQRQAPPPSRDDPSLYELPPLVIDGIPTPVEKMTQAQLRAFIPLMLKYSTGRGKPGWGRESTKPLWWPKEIPWANVRMDARSEDEKQKCRNAQVSWTHALRQIVINCYKFHGREDLLPAFQEDDEHSHLNGMADETSDSTHNEQLVQHVASVGVLKYHQAGKGVSALSPAGVSTTLTSLANVVSSASASTVSVSSVSTNTNTMTMTSAPVSVSSASPTLAQAAQYGTATVLQTINNPDGSVSLIQVDPNNPIITLPDGTTAQVQGVASALTDVTSDGVVDINNVTEATLINHDGQLILTGEDGHEYAVKLCSVNEKLWQQGSTLEKSLGSTSSQRTQSSAQSALRSQGQDTAISHSAYPVAVSGMISVPVSASMYQTMVQNDCTMQVVTVPKVEAGSSGGEVETISIPSSMVGTPIMMSGNEPQVLQVFSLKDGTVLKTITSVADIKAEEAGEVLGPS